jgi:hypothetical protein
MKALFPRLAVLTLSLASLYSQAALQPWDFLGEPAQAPSPQRALVTAAANRTIVITGDTKQVNVTHYEVVRFVSNGREFTWYFDGLAQPGAFDLMRIAPEGFLDHGVTVYLSPSAIDFPGG